MKKTPRNRLSREYINSLPVIRFGGEVVMVTRPEQAATVVRHLWEEEYVGFDTESKPAFKKGISHPISLIQIASTDIAYLFQLKGMNLPEALADFLADETVKKIGIGIKGDTEKLKEFENFQAGGFVDLSHLAAEKGIIQVGARALTARYLQHRLVKTAQKTNWALPSLTRKQQIYAATDAWICLRIYPRLIADPFTYKPEEEEGVCFEDPEQ